MGAIEVLKALALGASLPCAAIGILLAMREFGLYVSGEKRADGARVIRLVIIFGIIIASFIAAYLFSSDGVLHR